MSLKFHNCFIYFDLIKFRENCEKEFEHEPICAKLTCWEGYNQHHIKHGLKQLVKTLTDWCTHHCFALVQLSN